MVRPCTTTETATARCACGASFEAATPTPGSEPEAVPKAGDVSICFACAKPYLFTEGLGVIPVDLSKIDPDLRRRIEEAQAQVRAFRKLHPSRVQS